ncbi:FixH family protein [Pelagibius sp.]|uniref:FixH family protein n=1 Tax=Pelagibius sp. TaxID=1931238 RepID=UPI00261C3F84|nr:FixH family protein [Pelagibius sp.]
MQWTTMEIRGKHVLFGMLAFFGVIILVNAIFVYMALNTWTGLTEENAYQKGLRYNETLAARDAQRDLGWQGAVALTALDDGSERLTVTLQDSQGIALTGLAVSAVLRRPTHEGFDQTLQFEERQSGEYETDLSLPLRGNWDLYLSARRPDTPGDAPAFEMKTRLWLK